MSMGVGCGGAGDVALTKLLIDSSDTKFTIGETVISSTIWALIVAIGV